VINTGFDITIVPGVTVGTFPNVFECASYTLPALSIGKYYTQPNAAGTELAAGTPITSTQQIYVYAVTANDCKSEASFTVFIGMPTPVDISQCEPYVLPALPIGGYYTGPAGTGTQIPSGPPSTFRKLYTSLYPTPNALYRRLAFLGEHRTANSRRATQRKCLRKLYPTGNHQWGISSQTATEPEPISIPVTSSPHQGNLYL
jgi:hypothetical protein